MPQPKLQISTLLVLLLKGVQKHMPALAAPNHSSGYTVGRLEASNNCRDAFLNVMLGLEIFVLAHTQWTEWNCLANT